jgi:hypothetical protein
VPSPPTYATATQFKTYTIDNPSCAGLTDDEIERVLRRAELDLDSFLDWPAPITATLRVPLNSLTAYQGAALSRATCAQAEYRLMRGEEEVSQDVDGISSVGAVSFSLTPPPRIGPKVAEELAGAGLFLRTGVADPTPEPAAGA